MYGNMYGNENENERINVPNGDHQSYQEDFSQYAQGQPKRSGAVSISIALIASIAAIICISILSGSFVTYKKAANGSGISVTGSASCDFESDLVVWRGSFSAYGLTPKDAYQSIKHDADVIRQYLLDNGISESEIAFSSVSISQRYISEYNDEGKFIGDYPDGYDLYQSLSVTSSDLDKVDTISRDITKLIESNIEFVSDSPEYYYTKLDELKLDLIAQATENAKERINIIADGTDADIDKLLTANLGVFQITAQNSASEEYSYGGTFNTSSRYKTASITVKLNYSTN